jgi:hypothetical protein
MPEIIPVRKYVDDWFQQNQQFKMLSTVPPQMADRYHKVSISIFAKSWDEETRYLTMLVKWLAERLDHDDWVHITGISYCYFYFTREEDAVMFSLKWS